MTEIEPNIDETLPEHEQELLDTALQESDQLLARSLHDDEVRRRRKRLIWLSVLVIGGVVMTKVLMGIMYGWLAVSAPVVAENKGRAVKEIVSKKSTNPSGPVADVVEDAKGEESLPDIRNIDQAERFAIKGWSAWKKQDYDNATAFFETAIGLDPQSSNAWNGSGWVQFNGGDSERALKSFQECLKLAPNHAAALNGMGQIHLSWKEYDQAAKYLLRAAKQDATASWSGLARLYLLTGEFKKATVWAERLAGQGEQNSLAKEMLAAARAGELTDELRKKIEPVGKRSTPDTTNFQQGWQLFFRGNYRSSEKLFREVLKTDIENPHAMNGLGWSLLNQGRHDEAKPLLLQAIELEKEHWGAMTGLAACFKAEGKLDEAIKLWERIVENSTSQNTATEQLAPIYLERKQYGKALKYYEKLVEWYPESDKFSRGLKQAKEGLNSKK